MRQQSAGSGGSHRGAGGRLWRPGPDFFAVRPHVRVLRTGLAIRRRGAKKTVAGADDPRPACRRQCHDRAGIGVRCFQPAHHRRKSAGGICAERQQDLDT